MIKRPKPHHFRIQEDYQGDFPEAQNEDGEIELPEDTVGDEFDESPLPIAPLQQIKTDDPDVDKIVGELAKIQERLDVSADRVASLEQEVGVLIPSDYANAASTSSTDPTSGDTPDDDTPIDQMPDFTVHGDGDTAQSFSDFRSISHDSQGLLRIVGFNGSSDCNVMCRQGDSLTGITQVVYRPAGGVAVTCDTRADSAGTWATGFAFANHRHHIAKADSSGHSGHVKHADCAGHADSAYEAWHAKHADTALYADYAGYADEVGYCVYSDCAGHVANFNHTALTDIIAGTETADNHCNAFRGGVGNNISYLRLNGDATRNAMGGAIGDCGKVLSIDPQNRGLWTNNPGLDGFYNSVDWQWCQLKENGGTILKKTVDWAERSLWGADPGGTPVRSIKWGSRRIYDKADSECMRWDCHGKLKIGTVTRLIVNDSSPSNGAAGGSIYAVGGIDVKDKVNALSGFSVATDTGITIAGFCVGGIVTKKTKLGLITIQVGDGQGGWNDVQVVGRVI